MTRSEIEQKTEKVRSLLPGDLVIGISTGTSTGAVIIVTHLGAKTFQGTVIYPGNSPWSIGNTVFLANSDVREFTGTVRLTSD